MNENRTRVQPKKCKNHLIQQKDGTVSPKDVFLSEDKFFCIAAFCFGFFVLWFEFFCDMKLRSHVRTFVPWSY